MLTFLAVAVALAVGAAAILALRSDLRELARQDASRPVRLLDGARWLVIAGEPWAVIAGDITDRRLLAGGLAVMIALIWLPRPWLLVLDRSPARRLASMDGRARRLAKEASVGGADERQLADVVNGIDRCRVPRLDELCDLLMWRYASLVMPEPSGWGPTILREIRISQLRRSLLPSEHGLVQLSGEEREYRHPLHTLILQIMLASADGRVSSDDPEMASLVRQLHSLQRPDSKQLIQRVTDIAEGHAGIHEAPHEGTVPSAMWWDLDYLGADLSADEERRLQEGRLAFLRAYRAGELTRSQV